MSSLWVGFSLGVVRWMSIKLLCCYILLHLSPVSQHPRFAWAWMEFHCSDLIHDYLSICWSFPPFLLIALAGLKRARMQTFSHVSEEWGFENEECRICPSCQSLEPSRLFLSQGGTNDVVKYWFSPINFQRIYEVWIKLQGTAFVDNFSPIWWGKVSVQSFFRTRLLGLVLTTSEGDLSTHNLWYDCLKMYYVTQWILSFDSS